MEAFSDMSCAVTTRLILLIGGAEQGQPILIVVRGYTFGKSTFMQDMRRLCEDTKHRFVFLGGGGKNFDAGTPERVISLPETGTGFQELVCSFLGIAPFPGTQSAIFIANPPKKLSRKSKVVCEAPSVAIGTMPGKKSGRHHHASCAVQTVAFS